MKQWTIRCGVLGALALLLACTPPSGGSSTSTTTTYLPSDGVSVVEEGTATTCAIRADRSTWCTGADVANGQEAEFPKQWTMGPIVRGEIPPGVDLVQLSSVHDPFCGLGSDGWAYCWGAGDDGDLGNGSTEDVVAPVAVHRGAVPDGVTFTQVAAGQYRVCAIGTDAQVYCWGMESPSSSTGPWVDHTEPYRLGRGSLPAGVRITSLVGGTARMCGLGSDAWLYCWGDDILGERGTLRPTSEPAPLGAGAMGSSVRFRQVDGGSGLACGVGTDGWAYCWGFDYRGELGDGQTTPSEEPVAVGRGEIPDGVTFTEVVAGASGGCGLATDLHAYCWGDNQGQIGDGTTTDPPGPVAVAQGDVPSGVHLRHLELEETTACAIGTDDRAYCWGSNYSGQLGLGATSPRRLVPTVLPFG
jgi:alpha-tubulin suppressor-like RCC1 family protein